MGSNLHDVYYCQMDRNTELSNRMSERNMPSHQWGKVILDVPLILMQHFFLC